MADLDVALVDDIRAASRLMVRELGFMDTTVAATDYPPSAVHTILEIGTPWPDDLRCDSPIFCGWRNRASAAWYTS